MSESATSLCWRPTERCRVTQRAVISDHPHALPLCFGITYYKTGRQQPDQGGVSTWGPEHRSPAAATATAAAT